jgi:alpha-beta hydrolase superfamily lysophospholipase
VKWSSHHQVRGVVQIAHGLGQHMGRYAELVEKLVDADFDDLFPLDNRPAIVRST